MTAAQRRALEELALRSINIRYVDGRSLPVLARNGWVESFRGNTYSCDTIVGITEAGRAALAHT